MNRSSAMTVLLLFCWLCAGRSSAASAEGENARQHGARGQVTLHVTDTTGKPVKHAQLSLALFPSDSYANVDVREGQTGSNGCFGVEGTTVGDMTYTITKTNYYKTTGKYLFYRRGEDCVQNGRWQPWGATNTVVLKERREPVAMYAKRVDSPVPVRDVAVGFDLEIGDWIAPHGAGKQGDVYFTYKVNAQDFWTGSYELTIACSNKMDGFVRTQKDTWSEFLSAYEAPNSGYDSRVVLSLDITKDKILKKELCGEEEYLFCRVRTVLNDKGDIVSAWYGKMYGPIEFGVGKKHHVRFTYYLNPDGTRNLEFDPEKNLFGKQERGKEVCLP